MKLTDKELEPLESIDRARALIREEMQAKTGVLDLRDLEMTGLPEELFGEGWTTEMNLEHVREIYLGNALAWGARFGSNELESSDFPSDAKGWAKLKNLVTLSFDGLEVELPSLPTTVNDLTLPEGSEENLNLVRNLPNLRRLSWFFGEVDNFEPLRHLHNLESLELNTIRGPFDGTLDFSALGSLPSLERLTLEGSHITDLSALGGLSKLRFLDVADTELQSLTGIELLRGLKELRTEQIRNLADLSPLAALSELEILNVSNMDVSDLSPIAGLTNLQELDARGYAGVSDLAPLANLSNLRKLDIRIDDSLHDLGHLRGLSSLEELVVRGSGTAKIRDLSPLSKLSCLRRLKMDGTNTGHQKLPNEEEGLVSIPPLSCLTNLNEIDLTGFRWLTDIGGLSDLENLERLKLSDSWSLKEFGPVSDLQNLTNLTLNNCNDLEDLSPFSGLAKLRILNLSGCNRVKELSPLRNLVCLEEIYLTGTAVKDPSPLLDLPNLRYADPFFRFSELNEEFMFKGELVPYDQEPTKLEFTSLNRDCGTEDCKEKVQRLLAVPGGEIGREPSKTYFVDRCLNCFFDGTVSFQYNDSGEIVWGDDDFGDCGNVIDDDCKRNAKASVKWAPVTAKDLAVWEIEYGFRAGEPIVYLHGGAGENEDEPPKCPKCDELMEFILRLPSEAMDGMMRNEHWKGTELENFCVTIEHYATLFLFRCESCNVSTTFTECT